MSVFSNIGNNIEGAFGFGPNATAQYNALQNQVQPVDPRLQTLVDQQNQQAQQFQANLPSYEQDQYSVASGQMKQQAENTSQDITASANQRGLLYSGLNQGAQQQNLGNLSVGLANSKAGINQNAQNTSSQMNSQAIQGSEGLLNAQNQVAQQQYNAQMTAYNSKMNGLGQIGSAAGGLGLAAGLLLM